MISIETSLFCVKFMTSVIIKVTNLNILFISQCSMMILCIRRYAMVGFDHGKGLIIRINIVLDGLRRLLAALLPTFSMLFVVSFDG